jgi:hypothetical protein
VAQNLVPAFAGAHIVLDASVARRHGPGATGTGIAPRLVPSRPPERRMPRT